MRQRAPLAGVRARPAPGGTASASTLVAGIDEAGRGPLAGPVVVAAVVFDPARPRINGLDDSKQLTPARREALYARIVERALAWHVVAIDAEQSPAASLLRWKCRPRPSTSAHALPINS